MKERIISDRRRTRTTALPGITERQASIDMFNGNVDGDWVLWNRGTDLTKFTTTAAGGVLTAGQLLYKLRETATPLSSARCLLNGRNARMRRRITPNVCR